MSDIQSGSVDVILIIIIGILVVIMAVLLIILFQRNMQKKSEGQTPGTTHSAQKDGNTKVPDIRQRVVVLKNGFLPLNIAVTEGTQVIWTNSSGAAIDIKSDKNLFQQQHIENNMSYSFTFQKPGVFTISTVQSPSHVQHISVSSSTP